MTGQKASSLSVQELLASVVAYEGVTTADGAVGKTTLIDSALIGLNDFITGKTIILLDGNSYREDRLATVFDPATGTITFTALSARVLAGTSYLILNVTSGASFVTLLANLATLTGYVGTEGATSLANKLTAARAAFLDVAISSRAAPGAAMTLTTAERNRLLATKTSSTPLTSGNLFTIAGSVAIIAIIGRISSTIAGAATTVKLSQQMGALAAQDLCATLDINAFLAGTLLSITGTPADTMVGATGVAMAALQATPIVLTCAAGVITVTFGAATAGAIVWEVLWIPLNAAGSVT